MNKKKPNESVFKTRKFYLALYSCLGIMLVLAAVISFANLNAVKPEPQNAVSERESDELKQTVSESYLTPEDRAETDISNWSAIKPADTEAPKTTEAPKATANPSATIPDAAPKATTNPSTPAAPTPSMNPAPKQESKSEASPSLTPNKSTSEEETEGRTAERLAEPIFQAFNEDAKMIWPVLGEIVMDYSTDRLVYDKTLDQYRTNDSICISAAAGTQVKASAEGVVKSVTRTKENGNMLVIDNGNGWLTTYSQLQDQVLVKEGDVVKAGQVIGGVNNPSIFSVLLGSHLNFSVTKDNVNVDPKSLMSQS